MFDRANIHNAIHASRVAHGGEGSIGFVRLADETTLSGGCNFIDHAILPPGVSIGMHQHTNEQEELYLILSGTGTMARNGATFRVQTGDLIRNPPSGTHSLRNTGTIPLSIFVFELQVTPS